MAVTGDLIKEISHKTDLSSAKAEACLNNFVALIADTLREGNKLELKNFGTFRLARLAERKLETKFGKNKQVFTIPATIIPDFIIEPAVQNQIVSAIKKIPESAHVENSFLFTRRSNIRYIELAGKKIPKEILQTVPEKIARKFRAVPFSLKDNTISIAMTDPENEEAFNAIRKYTGKIVEEYITTQEDIDSVLDQYSALQNELQELITDEEGQEVESVKEEEEKKISDEDMTDASPAAKIVSSLMKKAVRDKASDIHIEPTEEEVEVRMRVDGVLQKVLALPKEVQTAVVSRIKILSNLKIDETRLPQDGRIQIMLDGRKIDFRISTMPTVAGEKVVARVLDRSGGVLTFDQLGLQGRSLNVMEENVTKAHGMTLVTGPTGSGKSTTLYAIINRLKNVAVNIITMEDPVEYRMPGVNQSQVNGKIGYNFANGLRSILRQDPDIIMVGEIRDRETADIAINAALTGHIVLSSLHTNDSAGALPRLLDMDIEPFLITSSTNLIIAQRLCRKVCDKCREETQVRPEEIEVIKKEIDLLPQPEQDEAKKKHTFYHGKGCANCSNTGYKGRIGIFEVLAISEPIKQLTLKHASSAEISTQAAKEGFITMKQDGIIKSLDALTTIEEVWRVTKD